MGLLDEDFDSLKAKSLAKHEPWDRIPILSLPHINTRLTILARELLVTSGEE